jgi:hypothetical protein
MFHSTVEGTRQSPVVGKILKDGKPLTAKDVTVSVADDKVTFTFTKPANSQSGKYQIKLSNEQGEDTKDININMQGRLSITSLFVCREKCIHQQNSLQTLRALLKRSIYIEICDFPGNYFPFYWFVL